MKKKILSCMFAGAILLGAMSIPAFAEDTVVAVDERGIEYTSLYTALADNTETSDTVTLCGDVVLTEDWVPIAEFKGTFDGNGHSVTGLTIADTSAGYCGMFRKLTGAKVENVKIDAKVTANGWAGVLAGLASGAEIQKCTVSGTLTVSNNDILQNSGVAAAGLVEYSEQSVITNCTSSVEVTAEGKDEDEGYVYAGGIVCEVNGGTISDCTNTGDVRAICWNTIGGYTYVGGVATYLKGGASLTNCINSGTAASGDARTPYAAAGGILASIEASETPITFTGCTNSGAVETDASTAEQYKGNKVAEVYEYTAILDEEGNCLGYKKWQTPVLDADLAEGDIGWDMDDEMAANVQSESGIIYHTTLEDAVKFSQNGDKIKLVTDVDLTEWGEAEYNVLDISGKTLDLNGKTITSENSTKFVVFQGVNAAIKNGTFAVTNGNYSLFVGDEGVTDNFVVEDVTLTGINVYNASKVILRNVNSTGKNFYAVWADQNAEVIVESGTYIKGNNPNVPYVVNCSDTDGAIRIKGGDFTGPLTTITSEMSQGVLEVTGGTFDDTSVEKYIVDTHMSVKNSDGNYIIVMGNGSEITEAIELKLVPTENDHVYDIVLASAEDGKYINRFSSAELKFAIKNKNGYVSYTIVPETGVNMTCMANDVYGFNLDGLTAADASGYEIKIASVEFGGYGTFSFACVGYPDAKVNTAEFADNIVNTYIPDGSGENGDLKLNGTAGVMNESDDIAIIKDKTLAKETKTLDINIAFPNTVENAAEDYQKMTVTISGGDLAEDKIIALGSGTDAVFKDVDGVMTYQIKIADTLTQNMTYMVTVSGDGYRTVRYSVNMNDNKILNFWNNAKDEPAFVEVGKDSSGARTTFLAGDIVKDNIINLYDLSAVVSYFGEDELTAVNHPEYAKYDLNRDGKIDSKDVAMVLVSWGE